VSRIWKALKQAEKERSRSKERQHAGHSPADPHAHPDADKRAHSPAHPPERSPVHPHSDGADRRRSERWEQPVPVMVYGSDSGKPFHEQTETADINDDGCSFIIATTVTKGQRLFLVNMLNDAERECRVVQAGHRSRGKAHVAIEFSTADPDFWLPRKN
jgi:PilZ domain